MKARSPTETKRKHVNFADQTSYRRQRLGNTETCIEKMPRINSPPQLTLNMANETSVAERLSTLELMVKTNDTRVENLRKVCKL